MKRKKIKENRLVATSKTMGGVKYENLFPKKITDHFQKDGKKNFGVIYKIQLFKNDYLNRFKFE